MASSANVGDRLASRSAPAPVDAHQYLESGRAVVDIRSCFANPERGNMLSIVVMLLLLVGFYGLFAGLVFFAEGVIEPDSTS
jgi:hypothetical protein